MNAFTFALVLCVSVAAGMSVGIAQNAHKLKTETVCPADFKILSLDRETLATINCVREDNYCTCAVHPSN